jgi:hypothetical protein
MIDRDAGAGLELAWPAGVKIRRPTLPRGWRAEAGVQMPGFRRDLTRD